MTIQNRQHEIFKIERSESILCFEKRGLEGVHGGEKVIIRIGFF